jgi:adenylate cyclase
MAPPPIVRRLWQALFTIGEYDGETSIDRGKRRIVVGYLFFGALARIPAAVSEYSDGVMGNGTVDLIAGLLSVAFLLLLALKPHWFLGIVNAVLAAMLVEVLAATVLHGGIIESNVVILFGVIAVIGALIVLSTRAAFLWLLAYGVTLALGLVLPEHIEPVDASTGSSAGIATTIVGVMIFLFAAMAYFVRQRDRFQKESDDLLHNILPDEIATRLKANSGMIADDYPDASVLFADVVNFTPMSAGLSPPELVGLLNDVFTTFDGFVEELGLEKIKTVGDEYMVASGVPHQRADHAEAIAELALRIRDHTSEHEFKGHRISLRIGINSGPVVAGIVGTHKFAYDLWGDVVNTASRMESEGIPGSIQITSATCELIRDRFICEPRGVISVKGKGDMETHLLVGRRIADVVPSPTRI